VNDCGTAATGRVKLVVASKPAPLFRFTSQRRVPTLASMHVDVVTRSGRRSPSMSRSSIFAHDGGRGSGSATRTGGVAKPPPVLG
jgi:hypothetical protein